MIPINAVIITGFLVAYAYFGGRPVEWTYFIPMPAAVVSPIAYFWFNRPSVR